MSDLPQYHRLFDVEEGSVGDKRSSSSAGLGEVFNPPSPGSKRIQLCFRPRYPCGGLNEDVQTMIGKTMEDTVAIAQAAFPPLREFPPDRVEFMIANGSDWERIMPNVWDEAIARDPPKRLGVRIADGSGDAEERKRREDKQDFKERTLPAVLVLFGLAVFLFFVANAPPKSK